MTRRRRDEEIRRQRDTETRDKKSMNPINSKNSINPSNPVNPMNPTNPSSSSNCVNRSTAAPQHGCFASILKRSPVPYGAGRAILQPLTKLAPINSSNSISPINCCTAAVICDYPFHSLEPLPTGRAGGVNPMKPDTLLSLLRTAYIPSGTSFSVPYADGFHYSL